MTKIKTPQKEAIRLTQLWQKYGPNSYPLDVSELIDSIINDSSFQGSLKTQIDTFDSFEGCLLRTEKTDNWTILLNEAIVNDRRQRFTYAHELGHFMCHREIRDSFKDHYDNLNDFRDNIEKEANVFASWILMPNNLLREEFSQDSWNTEILCNIGNRFECSLQASALRYVKLFAKKPRAFVVSRDGIILWACRSDSAPFMPAYCFGSELPKDSHAVRSYELELSCNEQQSVGHAWSDQRTARESQYFDSSGRGYQYTCIEFDEEY